MHICIGTHSAFCPLLLPVVGFPAWSKPPPPTVVPLVSTTNTGMPGVGVKPTDCRIAQHCASTNTASSWCQKIAWYQGMPADWLNKEFSGVAQEHRYVYLRHLDPSLLRFARLPKAACQGLLFQSRGPRPAQHTTTYVWVRAHGTSRPNRKPLLWRVQRWTGVCR